MDLQAISSEVVANQGQAALSGSLAHKLGLVFLVNKELDRVHKAQMEVLALALEAHQPAPTISFS